MSLSASCGFERLAFSLSAVGEYRQLPIARASGAGCVRPVTGGGWRTRPRIWWIGCCRRSHISSGRLPSQASPLRPGPRRRAPHDGALLTRVLRAFLQVVFAWQRRRARALSASPPSAGAVTAIARAGGMANLNIHFHSTLPDGVFASVRCRSQPCRRRSPAALTVGRGDRVSAFAVTNPRTRCPRIEVARVAHRGAPPPRSAARARVGECKRTRNVPF